MNRVKYFMVLLGLFCVSFLHAEQRTSNGFDPNSYEAQYNKRVIIGVDVPKSTNPDKHVVRDRLEMDTGKHAEAYKEAQYKVMERNKVLNEVFDPMVLMTPVNRVIRPVDTMGISPAYITQIVFPHNMIITDVLPSFKPETMEYKRNSLRIRPSKRDFYTGNIIITMTDEIKNYTMTIFLERFFSKECHAEKSANTYICRRQHLDGITKKGKKYSYSYNNLSTLYRYTNPTPLNDLDVIQVYERTEGKLLHIRRNLDFVNFSYRGIEYTIKRDDRFGSFEGGVMYRGVGYRITNSMGGEV